MFEPMQPLLLTDIQGSYQVGWVSFYLEMVVAQVALHPELINRCGIIHSNLEDSNIMWRRDSTKTSSGYSDLDQLTFVFSALYLTPMPT